MGHPQVFTLRWGASPWAKTVHLALSALWRAAGLAGAAVGANAWVLSHPVRALHEALDRPLPCWRVS